MRKLLFSLLLFIHSFFTDAQTKKVEFVYGGSNSDWGMQIIQTKDKGFITVGTTLYGAGGQDIYMVKTDSIGAFQWTKTFGGTGDDEGYGITQTKDNGFVICGSTLSYGKGGNADVYVLKLDSAYNIMWSRTIGGAGYDGANAIIQTSDGGYAMCGWTTSFGAGVFDNVYVVKLDSAGHLKWTRTIGGTSVDEGFGLVESLDKGLVICGWTNSYGAGGYDVYVVKLDSAGKTKWTRTIGGSKDEVGIRVIRSKDGGYIIAGATASFGDVNGDVYIIKLDTAGIVQWTKVIGGTKADQADCIIQTKDGGYMLSGFTCSFGDTIGEVYILKLDSLANLEWTRTTGGPKYAEGVDLIQTIEGGYAIAGLTYSYSTNSMVYLVLLDSNGNTCSPDSTGGIDRGATTPLIGSGGIDSSGGRVDTGVIVKSGGTFEMICSTSSIEESKAVSPAIHIYPNPCSTTLNIDLKNQPNLSSLQITDITGRVLITYHCQHITEHYSIDVSSLSSGMYFLRLNSSTGTEVKKFIKEY